MKQNKLKSLWKQKKTAINTWLTIPSSWSAEIIANIGFDACTIDMQHGLADYQTALTMIQSINTTESVPLVRVPWNEPSLIMRMLDAGSYGIIAPMINNKQETQEFVNSCKYPPIGSRSIGPIRSSLVYGSDYFFKANEEVLALAMIETKAGLENIEEIAIVGGLDGFYIGTRDLSISLGLSSLGDLQNESLMSAIEQILTIAKKHNLIVGIHSRSDEEINLLKNLGVNLITPLNDSDLLRSSAEYVHNKYRKLLSK